jgi:hypothetical protein
MDNDVILVRLERAVPVGGVQRGTDAAIPAALGAPDGTGHGVGRARRRGAQRRQQALPGAFLQHDRVSPPAHPQPHAQTQQHGTALPRRLPRILARPGLKKNLLSCAYCWASQKTDYVCASAERIICMSCN